MFDLLKKVDAESLGPLPKFQVNIKIQLNAGRVSRLSSRFLYLCHNLKVTKIRLGMGQEYIIKTIQINSRS